MQPVLVTLTTDFGRGSSYVAAMKGSLLGVAPHAHIVDLSHDLPAQDLNATAMFLRDVLPYFPKSAIHVVVVDPGVGSDRAILLIEWQGTQLLAPDNGCWTLAIPKPDAVHRLNQPKFWRPSIAPTFHGRDIFAPVAGHIALGVTLQELGEHVDNWKVIELSRATVRGNVVVGEIVSVDRFGNLISNIHESDLGANDWTVLIADGRECEFVRTYSDRRPGTLICLIGSAGFVEVAVAQGSAAATLRVGLGASITMRPALASTDTMGTKI